MESKYKSLLEWKKADPKAYEFARKNNFLDDICENFGWIRIKKQSGYWTKERCKIEALKYEGRWDWQKGHTSSYSQAKKKGWLDECCAHMESKLKPNGYWTKEKCMNEAKKYQYKPDWKKNSWSSHSAAIKNDWYKECTEHMESIKFKWNKETLLASANKYKTTTEFIKHSSGAYQTAIKLDCLDYVTQNLKKTNKKNK